MKGFSILEELIVIAIASILAAIAIPNFLNVVNNLTTTEAGQTLNNIVEAQQYFYYQKGYFADTWSSLQLNNNSLKYNYSIESFNNNQNSLLKAAPKLENLKGAIAGIEAVRNKNQINFKYSICEAKKPGRKAFEREAVEYRQKKVKCERSKKVN